MWTFRIDIWVLNGDIPNGCLDANYLKCDHFRHPNIYSLRLFVDIQKYAL